MQILSNIFHNSEVYYRFLAIRKQSKRRWKNRKDPLHTPVLDVSCVHLRYRDWGSWKKDCAAVSGTMAPNPHTYSHPPLFRSALKIGHVAGSWTQLHMASLLWPGSPFHQIIPPSSRLGAEELTTVGSPRLTFLKMLPKTVLLPAHVINHGVWGVEGMEAFLGVRTRRYWNSDIKILRVPYLRSSYNKHSFGMLSYNFSFLHLNFKKLTLTAVIFVSRTPCCN